MRCNLCRINEAIVYMEQVQEDEKKTLNLCVDCAIKHGIITRDLKLSLFPQSVFKKLLKKSQASHSSKENLNLVKCRKCGTMYTDFNKTKTVGCQSCWNIFGPAQLGKSYNTITYQGKVLSQVRETGKVLSVKERQEPEILRSLKIRLKQLVEKEKYEEAIEIRDSIRNMESKTRICS